MKNPDSLTGVINNYTPAKPSEQGSPQSDEPRLISQEYERGVEIQTLHDDINGVVIYRFIRRPEQFEITDSDLEAIAQHDNMHTDLLNIARDFDQWKKEVASWKKV